MSLFAYTVDADTGRDWLDGHASDLDLVTAPEGAFLVIGYVRNRRDMQRALAAVLAHGGPVLWNQSAAGIPAWFTSEANGERRLAQRDAVDRLREECRRNPRLLAYLIGRHKRNRWTPPPPKAALAGLLRLIASGGSTA